MKRTRRKHSAAFKTKVAIEALKERQSLQELANKYELSQSQICKWKKAFLDGSSKVFETGKTQDSSNTLDPDKLYAKIGRLELENDFFKKKLKETRNMKERRKLVSRDEKLSIRHQCKLLCISRSSFYYTPVGESSENLEIMRLMDEHSIRHPTYGVLQMQGYLKNIGYNVNVKRVRRLLRKMGHMAIYPKKNLSKL